MEGRNCAFLPLWEVEVGMSGLRFVVGRSLWTSYIAGNPL
jgi:hypothetical protein